MITHAIAAGVYRAVRRLLLGTGISTVRPFSTLKAAIGRYLRSAPVVNVQGHRMLAGSSDLLNLAVLGVWEPEETELVRKLVRPGDTVVDLGGNIGYFTLIMARQAGPQGRVFVFEPGPDNFAILRRNVEMNGYRTIVMEPKAVANFSGKVRLHMAAAAPVDHRIFGDPDEQRESCEVDCVRLDDYPPLRNAAVSFVKIDVQGAEEMVLHGMEQMLRRNRGIKLLIEFWPFGLRKAGTDPAKMLEYIASLGFRMFSPRKGGRLEPVEPSTLAVKRDAGRDYYVNFLLARP
jgi:FkbM family methyltransferase